MDTVLRLAKLAAFIALTAFLLILTHAVRTLQPKAEYTLDNANRLIRETAETSANVRHATAEWEKASQYQALYATGASKAAQKSFEDFDALIKRTDFQLNQQVLPQIGQAITVNSAQLVELEKTSTESFTRIANDADKLTADTSSVMRAATRNLSDPAIADTLKHLDETSAETAATAADIRQVTDKIRNDFMHPTKFGWALLKELAGFGGSLAQMVK
jgi:hypothetical protein